MIEFISNATIIIAVIAAASALSLVFYVGYITGKEKANTVTYAALNNLIIEWNRLIKQMPPMPSPGPKLDIRKKG